MNRVSVNPELITWARERAGLEPLDLTGRFSKLPDWESGELQPTLRQLEGFARAVHVPIGYLFLPEPPAEPLPIPDFWTVGERRGNAAKSESAGHAFCPGRVVQHAGRADAVSGRFPHAGHAQDLHVLRSGARDGEHAVQRGEASINRSDI